MPRPKTEPKHRLMIAITKEDFESLKRLAEQECRSCAGYLSYLLKQEISRASALPPKITRI